MRVRSKSRWVPALKAVAVLAILCWSLAPIVFMVMSSVKPGQDIFAVPPHWAFTPTLKHYVSLWARWQGFFHGLVNSLIITVGASVLVIVASTMAGFAYSRNRAPFLQRSATFHIVVRLLPPIVVTLPLFGVVNALHLNDTHLILILLYATFFVSLGTILMRTFIDQIPYELDEAAMVDGANRATILWTVGHSRALHPVGESLRRNPFALSLSKSPSTSSGQASTGSAGTAK